MAAAPISLAELDQIEVGRLKGVGPKKEKGLHSTDIRSLYDLLTLYPRRYIDRTKQAQLADLAEGEEANVLVTIERTTGRRIRGGKSMVTSVASDGETRLDLTFFNQPWRERQLTSGTQAVVYGKLGFFRGKRQMSNPIVDLVGNKTGRIIPVYRQSEKAGLTSSDIGEWVSETLRRTLPPKGRGVQDPLPSSIIERHRFLDRGSALQNIHSPETFANVSEARRRLVFDELLRMQLHLVQRKRHLEATQVGVKHQLDGPSLKGFRASLPFELTGAQERAIQEIAADLARPSPMHRLLQGDVGSGKTLVAVAAMLTAVDGGHQAALMVPTEVLAEQHSVGIGKLVEGLTLPDPGSLLAERPLKVELLANRITGAERKRLLAAMANGEVDIVVGTHALIQEAVEFASLGLVVIDEQHRFGVEQRSALKEKSGNASLPDELVMTATPIPRTAAMTVYGDLDVSVLDELPPGRTPIVTKWVDAAGSLEDDEIVELQDMWAEVYAEVEAGRQVYVVCPLIDESEKLEVASAETIFARLSNQDLRGLQLGLLHGRLSPAEKDATMDSFRSGDLQVLVATTVIEVGVDVPNATVMVILDADRFGIAQLHQLRGRVGRGEHASVCWLVGSPATPDGEARLEALVASTDGFELAEVDLELRGEGTILGERQKGQNDLKLASLRRDADTVRLARQEAIELIDSDPGFQKHQSLQAELSFVNEASDTEFLMKN